MRSLRLWLLIPGILLAAVSHAEHLMMVRVKQSFPEAMLKLQEVIKQNGYTLSRVQRVDIGLSKSGYQTDKYRVVFFGKQQQNRWLIDNHPEMLPYLPLKIGIYAEGEDTLLVTYNPQILFAPKNPKLAGIVGEWNRDLHSMLKSMQDYTGE